MSLAIMQRFPSQDILKLRQIGLAFFEKIATDQALAGETQDFYQGLLVGFDRAVKLIDEEDGLKTLSLLEAKLATFIDTQSDDSEQSQNFTSAFSGCESSICRLSPSYIARIKKIGIETYFDPDVKGCVCPGETQDFYHGCLAAIDFAISLAGEKYAYAQISLLKTNVAYFINLDKDWERQVNLLETKGMAFLKRKDLYQEQEFLDDWIKVQADSDLLKSEAVMSLSKELDEDEMSFKEKLEEQTEENSVKKVESNVDDLSKDDFSTNLVLSTTTRDIEQLKLAEFILPVAQRAFEYVLNFAPERVEETDEYTRVQVGGLYNLIVKESEGISVSSLRADGRGELIRVRGENLILAQGILSVDVEFWSMVAQRLDQIDATTGKQDKLINDGTDVETSDDIEI